MAMIQLFGFGDYKAAKTGQRVLTEMLADRLYWNRCEIVVIQSMRGHAISIAYDPTDKQASDYAQFLFHHFHPETDNAT